MLAKPLSPRSEASGQASAGSSRPTIGVLAGWQFYWTATPLSYLHPLYEGLCAAARDHDCNLLLACGLGLTAAPSDPLRPAWPDPAPEVDFVPVGPWNTSGLIVINPLHSPARSRYVRELKAAGHPVLFVGSGEGGPEIVADNAQGIQQAMRHLVEHGHRRIAFIAGSPDDLAGDSGDRLRAYQAALRADPRLAADPALVAYGRHVSDGGQAAMREILASGSPFSAVLASNDESAFGALQALREAGRRVPEDVALIGFDDRPEALVQAPPLSSVRISLHDLGYQALESLLSMLAAPSAAPRQKRVPTQLMPRQSCGCGLGGAPRAPALDDAPDPVGRTARAMAQAVQSDARRLKPTEIQAACDELAVVFAAGDGSAFQGAWEAVLRRCQAAGEDVSAWQAALAHLSRAAPVLAGAADWPASAAPVAQVFDQAWWVLAVHMRRQLRQQAVDQQRVLDRLGHLTARLLLVTDEAQVFAALSRHLPEMQITRLLAAFFEAEAGDPLAWSAPHWVPALDPPPARFPSRRFPPPELFPPGPAFQLALLPLVGPRGQQGYAVFDCDQLDLYGSIVQQLAAALDRAQLYRDAVEGRRLAEEAAQLKSRFLSTVSHELRTPLNLIGGLSELLLKESELGEAAVSESVRQDLERIYANAQHLGGLIGDVLDLASSDAGQLRLTCEWVDLSQTLQLVAEIGRQLAADKGLAWRVDLPESGPWVWGDRTRLRQIVLNLVNNAIKFTARGQVSLKVETNNQMAQVTVRDTGIGVPREEQALVFDEFRRSQRSLTGGYGGLGLGLAICKRLVDLHGGALWLESPGLEGGGSAFHVTLPIGSPADDPARQPGSEPGVLLLGRPENSRQLQADLARLGFAVRTAEFDGSQAHLTRLLAAPASVLVVDLGLATEQGWEVLRILRANPASQGIPVLFYTLSADQGAILKLDYLTKPVRLEELTQALDLHGLIPSGGAAGKTILIVDDDSQTVEMHARMVRSHSAGHRLLTASAGRQALAWMQTERVDLVLLDLLMPEMDGFEVLAAMRSAEATRDIPVIVLTGQSLTQQDMRRLNQGVAMVLSKGVFSAAETVTHIQAALDRQRKLGSQAQRLARLAVAYIHQHYAESISREDLARHLGMNEDYLTQCFRKELGMTPIEYLNRYRIHQAKALLADHTRSITEIALAVGFADSGYFSRVFRQKVGQSPEAFRKG